MRFVGTLSYLQYRTDLCRLIPIGRLSPSRKQTDFNLKSAAQFIDFAYIPFDLKSTKPFSYYVVLS